MENLTNQQMREILKNNGINGTSKMNKTELIHHLLYLNKSNPMLRGGDYLGDLRGLIKDFDKKVKPMINKSKTQGELLFQEMKIKQDLKEKVKRSPKKEFYMKNFENELGHLVGKRKKEIAKKVEKK